MSDCSTNAFKTPEKKAHVLDIIEQAKRELKAEFEHDRALSLTLTKLDEAELWIGRTKEAK